MNEITQYFQWLINPVKKGKEIYIIVNAIALSVAITFLLFLLSKLLRITSLHQLRDIFISIAALNASIVAILGLEAWKKQYKGKTDYEIARRYLKAVLTLKNSIIYLRNPFISSGEMETALKEHGLDSSEYTNYQKTNRVVYSARWKKVQEAWSDLEAELPEAELSWGTSALTISKPLLASVKELLREVQIFLDGYSDDLKKELIYNQGTDESPDVFMTKLIENTSNIEKYLKKHLR